MHVSEDIGHSEWMSDIHITRLPHLTHVTFFGVSVGALYSA